MSDHHDQMATLILKFVNATKNVSLLLGVVFQLEMGIKVKLKFKQVSSNKATYQPSGGFRNQKKANQLQQTRCHSYKRKTSIYAYSSSHVHILKQILLVEK